MPNSLPWKIKVSIIAKHKIPGTLTIRNTYQLAILIKYRFYAIAMGIYKPVKCTAGFQYFNDGFSPGQLFKGFYLVLNAGRRVSGCGLLFFAGGEGEQCEGEKYGS